MVEGEDAAATSGGPLAPLSCLNGVVVVAVVAGTKLPRREGLIEVPPPLLPRLVKVPTPPPPPSPPPPLCDAPSPFSPSIDARRMDAAFAA